MISNSHSSKPAGQIICGLAALHAIADAQQARRNHRESAGQVSPGLPDLHALCDEQRRQDKAGRKPNDWKLRSSIDHDFSLNYRESHRPLLDALRDGRLNVIGL